MLATRISFMNQMANICDKLGADIMMVMRGLGSDSRIGQNSCFPVSGSEVLFSQGCSCAPQDLP